MKRTLAYLRPVLMDAEAAVADIPDRATIASGGFGYAGMPFTLLEALHKAGPRQLHLIAASVSGETFGVGPLAKSGQLAKVTTCYMGENKVFSHCFQHGMVDVELCPMGSLVARVNAGGTGVSAFYTTTGYNTFVSEGRLPQRLSSDGSGNVVEFTPPRETRFIDGKWNVLETALHADYAFVRAWKADRAGNLLFRGAARNSNPSMARCGKVTIAEVEEIVENGELDPNFIHLPGVYVDRLVHVPNPPRPIESIVTRDGDNAATTVDHSDGRHRMARRAALEVKDGMVLNLGIGTPNLVTNYIPKDVNVVLMAGNGILGLGPFPTREEIDPDIINSSKQTATIDPMVGPSFIDCIEAQGLIRGGHVSVAMLGTMEVAENGDLANWMVPGKRISGMGGGMELVQSGCKVVLLMQHVNKDGTPKILHRCACPLTGEGVVDMIITELGVFEFTRANRHQQKQLVLKELADGVTLEEIKAKTEANFTVSEDLKPMQLAPIQS